MRVNGKDTTHINLQDRGLQYGDGLFETIAVSNGRLEFWQRHMQRLQLGCRRLNIPPPDSQLLLDEARQIVGRRHKAVLKIIITRGEGGRGYRPPAQTSTRPNRIVSLHDWPDYTAANASEGISLRYCSTPLGINPVLAGVKHLNRLEQVMARSEWNDAEIQEGIMLNSWGDVIEGTMSNLFFIKDGMLHSPDLSNCGVAGIMRGVILELARSANIPLKVGCYNRADMDAADELFITNSLIGIWPVQRLEQRSFDIGPLTRQIMSTLDNARCNDISHETV